MIASFDIGEVNFAYCIGTPDVIVTLRHFNIKKKSRQTIIESCDAISEVLFAENFDDCSKVIIEQQMRTNIRAQRLAQHVWSWFRLLYPRLNPEFVSASIKTQRNLTYRQRKTAAIDALTKTLVDRNDKNNLDFISSLPKQDDVADAYVQLVFFATKNEKIFVT